MKPLQTEKWQRKPSDRKKGFIFLQSQSFMLWRTAEHTWGLAACSMIFSSKVWSCSLTESLESPSLSSKLGSTKERKWEHSNPSRKKTNVTVAEALCSPPKAQWRRQPHCPSAEQENHQEPPSSPGKKDSSESSSQCRCWQSEGNTHTEIPHLCQSGPWSDLASGTPVQRWCQSPGEPPASTEQAMN